MKKLKIVLLGTSDFAVPTLKNLIAQKDYDLRAVVIQPDRPNKRGKKIEYVEMKKVVLAHDIPVFQPEKIKTQDACDQLRAYEADLFIVAAYGQILSQEILDMPPMGCLNIHGSLLPDYRGAAPIHHAIIDGKMTTGVTIMQVSLGMDEGDMLAKHEEPITPTTTVGQLHDRLAEAGADLLITTIEKLRKGQITPEAQDASQATYADKVDRYTGKIDFSETSFNVLRRINGTDPYPGAWCGSGQEKLKLFQPEIIDYVGEETPGTLLYADNKKGLIIKTADGAIKIKVIQVAGKKKMPACEFFKGHSLKVNQF